MILYFHGFNSAIRDADGAINSSKLAILQRYADSRGERLICQDYDYRHPLEVVGDTMIDLHQHVVDHGGYEDIRESFLFVGTSLGGWFAKMAADVTNASITTAKPLVRVGAVLINPSSDPTTGLAKYTNKAMRNFVNGRSYIFTDEHLSDYAKAEADAVAMIATDKPANPAPYLVLCDEADDVCPVQTVYDKYFEGATEFKIFPGGSHRFEHMAQAIEHIEEFRVDANL